MSVVRNEDISPAATIPNEIVYETNGVIPRVCSMLAVWEGERALAPA